MTTNMNDVYILARCLIKNYKGDLSEAPANYAEIFTVNISGKTPNGIQNISDSNFKTLEEAIDFVRTIKCQYRKINIDNNTSNDFKQELENLLATA